VVEVQIGKRIEKGGGVEECRLAFMAAMDLIEEKCGISFGEGRMVHLPELETTVRVPGEVLEIASENPELTRAERIKAISESEWARGWGGGMCRLVSPELVGEERDRCIERMARILAERVV